MTSAEHPHASVNSSAAPGAATSSGSAGVPMKEPRWHYGIPGAYGGRLPLAAIVTRAQWRRALKAARLEGYHVGVQEATRAAGRGALLSAAESCRECASKIREAMARLPEDDRRILAHEISSDHWDETALWLEARAQASA